jgi:hypothetical protein
MMLFRRRERTVLTWQGWLVVLSAAALMMWLATVLLHPFLAITTRVPAEVLVVEGWMPDLALAQAASEFKTGRYRRAVVTGGPIERRVLLNRFTSQAELAASTLEEMGVPANAVVAVTAPSFRKDRTYASAVALRGWFNANGGVPRAVNVMSLGPHARRTRLMFEEALGEQVKVGVIAAHDTTYMDGRWWTSSAGFRSMVSEVAAYVYARFFFTPPQELQGIARPPPAAHTIKEDLANTAS